MPPAGFYLIVRGPLGAGKSTIARRLARRLRGRYVSIDRILEERDLERWEDGYISEASFLRANEFAARAADRFLRHGTPAIVDGNFYWPRAIDDLIDRLPYAHAVLTLRLPVGKCRVRDAGRARPLGDAAVRDVYRKVTSFDRGLRVDARGSIDEVVARALDAARLGGVRLPGPARTTRDRPAARRRRSPGRSGPARRRPSPTRARAR